MEDTVTGDGWAGASIRGLRRNDPLEIAQSGIDRRVLCTALLVFAAYYVGAQLGFALTLKPHAVSVLWPPNSILLAALLLTPVRQWWIMLLAALPAHFLVEIQSSVPSRMVFCWFVSNSFEALIGASCIRYLIKGRLGLNRIRNFAIICLCGIFLGPFLSSFLDSAFVVLNRWGGDTYWSSWRIRFGSNALAAITITPLILAWARGGTALRQGISRTRLVEAGGLILVLLVLGYVLFNRLSPDADLALLYTPLPLLLWAAIRFGFRGATTAIATTAFLAIWGAVHGHGPFAEKSAAESAIYVQLFVTFMSLPLLFLAALTEEREAIRKTLQDREERISLAAETAHLGLWTIDFIQGRSWMNDKGRELFGFTPNKSLSRELFLSHVHPEDRGRIEQTIESARTKSQNFEMEFRVCRADGKTRWLISRGRYLCNNRGEARELLGVAIDVTAQVRANLELRSQQQELARLGRVAVMGELTASLAHELNQPLAAIAANAAAGRRFLAGGKVDPAIFTELLNDVFADARRAGDVIHGIRHFVRKGEEAKCSLSLNDVIIEVLRLLHSDFLGRSTSVETLLAPQLPTVQADPVQMQQVLINLIVNSLEAMEEIPPGKRKIEISTQISKRSVQVGVRDFGVGLPSDNPDKIFTHFYSSKPDGMGMGLAIVRTIVGSHGGELTAENLPDGARLCFSLPIEPSSAQPISL